MDNICESSTRYGHGMVPCVATMCGECEGMGCELWGEACADCRGTGRRPGVTPLRIALTETVAGLTEPLRFGWFWFREYGWSDEHTGGTVGAFRLTWRDHAYNRGALWRYARSRIMGAR